MEIHSTFESFGFSSSVLQGIDAIGYKTPSPVQQQAIPVIMQGRDIIASAQTGTGKTAAFLLPLVEKISALSHDHHVKALIIVPTRELALQIDQQMEGFSYYTNVSSIAIYGGTDGNTFTREKQALIEGADVIICTPGRLIAHLNMGYVKFPDIKYLILDEADRMLDMGFYDDIIKIITHLPNQRQNLMFSATMPQKIRQLARLLLHDPVEISLAMSKPATNIEQLAYLAFDSQKIPVIRMILKEKELKKVLIFCSTKEKTRQLTFELKRHGINAGEIHSVLDQEEREKVMNSFRAGTLPVLVATDIVSRGIDVDDIDMVINFDVPNDGEDYVHRIGRTARAESQGKAVTFINEKDQQRFAAIETLIEAEILKTPVPSEFGESPAYNPQKNRKSSRFRKGGGKRWGNKDNGHRKHK